MTDTIIAIRDLVNRFGKQVVHDHLDLDIKRNEILGIVGGSGTGKSVLMRSIIGLNTPASGSIRVMGEEVMGMNPDDILELQRHWGVLFQNGALFSSLTVMENILVPLREHVHLEESTRHELATLKIALSGLPPEAASKYPSELSGGMRKRAALARALALDPEILFLDEPTAGLDPIAAAAFDSLIATIQQSLGLTVVIITHDLDTLFSICHRVGVLMDKKIVADTLDNIVRYDHPWIKEYFHGPRGRAARQEK